MGRTVCTEPQCLYKGALYFTVELFLYSPYGPYGLYRASVPVEGCTLLYSRAIPLPPYGPYGLFRASVPVQGCTLPVLFTLMNVPCVSHSFYFNQPVHKHTLHITNISLNNIYSYMFRHLYVIIREVLFTFVPRYVTKKILNCSC